MDAAANAIGRGEVHATDGAVSSTGPLRAGPTVVIPNALTRGRARPRRVLEAEETVHSPTAILLPEQERDVPAELGHTRAAGVAPGLLEGAKLRRLIRRDASTRDGKTEIHVAQRRPVVQRHRRQLGRTANGVERR